MLEEFYKSTTLNVMQHLRNKTDTFDKRKKTREKETEKGKKAGFKFNSVDFTECVIL